MEVKTSFWDCCTQRDGVKVTRLSSQSTLGGTQNGLERSCYQCSGTGHVHRSMHNHYDKNCNFCTKCFGCGGTGNLPENTDQCSKCQGEGRIHDNPHVRHKAECFHCKPCKTCATKGWVQKKPEKVKLNAFGNQTCYKCEGIGKVHDSNIEHKEESCVFCKNCVGCNMTGKISNKANKCKMCHGKGKVHESSLEHTTPGCTFCKDCQECSNKGWV